MTTPIALVQDAEAVLFDFDGPICRIFSQLDLVAELSGAAHQVGLLPAQFTADPRRPDPLEMLRFVEKESPELLSLAEFLVTGIEMRGAALAHLEPGAETLLNTLSRSNVPWAIVSNNSVQALRCFAQRFPKLFGDAPLIGRVPTDMTLLKPNPHLIEKGLEAVNIGARRATMIGDSSSDLVAAKAAGVRSIALVNKPGKRDALAAAEPDAMVISLEELVEAS